jgi:hypothetical protein
VRNVLNTDLAERIYGQILDGLPTEEAIEESYRWIEDHPVHTTSHAELCSGYIDQARQFRAAFDLSELRFQLGVRDICCIRQVNSTNIVVDFARF